MIHHICGPGIAQSQIQLSRGQAVSGFSSGYDPANLQWERKKNPYREVSPVLSRLECASGNVALDERALPLAVGWGE